MNKDSKIFVAGHRGLVGSAILRKLQELGYRNILTRGHAEVDLERQEQTEAFFGKEKPEYVFLSAAKVGGIYANNTYKAEFIYQNLMIAANVINASYKSGVKKLLNLGSSCIYPKLARQPMAEDELLTGPLEKTNEPYAIAKIAAIKLCRYYHEQYGANFISVMPTNLYGPNDNFDFLNSHVLPALMRKIFLAKMLSEKKWDVIRRDLAHHDSRSDFQHMGEEGLVRHLETCMVRADAVGIWGTGKPFREFLYVDDLADASVFLMEKYEYEQVGEFVNVGTGTDISIKDLAQKIKEIVGFKGGLFFDSSKPDGTPRKLQDISRLTALGWKAGVPLEEGLAKTLEWYKEQA